MKRIFTHSTLLWKFVAIIIVGVFSFAEVQAQCPAQPNCNASRTITVNGNTGGTITATAPNQNLCIIGNGTFTGTINFNNQSLLTLYIAPGVTLSTSSINTGTGVFNTLINCGTVNNSIVFNIATINNYGTFTNNLSAGINVGSFTNRGTLVSNGSLNVSTNFTQAGSGNSQIRGLMSIGNAAIPLGGSLSIQGGTFQVLGTVITIFGSYNQTAGAVTGGSGLSGCGSINITAPLIFGGISTISGGTFGGNTSVRMCNGNALNPNGFTAAAPGTVNPNPTVYLTCDCARPLPITLVYFRAEYLEGKVKLNWATASEEDNDYFTIEKAKDGVSFTEVTRVEGAGNSAGLLTYQSIDTQPYEGTSYYRLKQTDLDGKYTYSKIVAVNAGGSSSRTAIIFPNPVAKDGFVQVAVNSEQTGDTYVTVYDQIGKQCFYAKYTGDAIPSIAVKEFSTHSGLYIIQARKGTTLVREKVIVQ